MAEPFESGPLFDDAGASVPTPPEDNLNVTPLDLDEDTASLVALILALKSIDPKLQQAYDEYMKPTRNMARVIALTKSSAFYQDYNKIARARKIAEKEQPGVYKQEKDDYITSQKKRIISQLGAAAWTDEVAKQVGLSFDFGLSDNALDKLIVATKTLGAVGGAQLGSIDALRVMANDYGVSDMFLEQYWNEKKDALFLGTTTFNDIQTEIKEMAKQTYPGFASGFDLNESLAAQTGYIVNTVAKVTGMDPSALKYSDPMVSQWYQYKDPKTGEFTRPPQYLVEQGTKEKYFDLYSNTPSGTAYLDGLTVKMLTDMGLI